MLSITERPWQSAQNIAATDTYFLLPGNKAPEILF